MTKPAPPVDHSQQIAGLISRGFEVAKGKRWISVSHPRLAAWQYESEKALLDDMARLIALAAEVQPRSSPATNQS